MLLQVREVMRLQLDAVRAALGGDGGPAAQLEQTLSHAEGLAAQIYRGVARGMIDYEPIVAQASATRVTSPMRRALSPH